MYIIKILSWYTEILSILKFVLTALFCYNIYNIYVNTFSILCILDKLALKYTIINVPFFEKQIKWFMNKIMYLNFILLYSLPMATDTMVILNNE